ncbi:MAG TPA: DNA polymerase/3'-5' exonuclease PolX [Gammaproteobacteria bacterium]|nr:DNA polymerase/3'-5' exonuclease PolX [Gammaproteobacteria bacterium]
MATSNKEIVSAFNELADILEAQGENPYKIRAYRRAARSINRLNEELVELFKKDYDFTSIPGVGKNIAAFIRDILQNQQLPIIEKTQAYLDKLASELLQISGIGSSRIKILQGAGIHNKEQLLEAIENGVLLTIPGFTVKTVNKLKKDILQAKASQKYLRLFHAETVVEPLLKHLKNSTDITTVECVDDYRRRLEVINKIVIVAASDDSQAAIKHLLKWRPIKEVFIKEECNVQARLGVGLIIDFHVVRENEYPTTLLCLTGSAAHLEKLQELAQHHGLTLKPQGLFKDNQAVSISDETSLYKKLDLPYIEPELRENRGEIEASQNNKLPKLIELKDIKGDLHCHTNESDGSEVLEDMVQKAIELGYEYLAITDHSQSLKITNGLDEKRLLQQIKQIDKLNEKLNGQITILKSSEIDILEDGRLDYPDYILKELDIRICSVHSYFRLPLEKQTERVIRAMDNPYFNVLGHATGRLIRRREPYAIDMEKIVQAAKERGCILEVNAQPYRLDINDLYCQIAKRHGVGLVISSDAHGFRDFSYMKYGVYQARRGWLEAKDVLNTFSLKELRKKLER